MCASQLVAGGAAERAGGLAEGAAEGMAAREGVGEGKREHGQLGVDRAAIALAPRAQQARNRPRPAAREGEAEDGPGEQRARAEREDGAHEQEPPPLDDPGFAPLAADSDDVVDEAGDPPDGASAPRHDPGPQKVPYGKRPGSAGDGGKAGSGGHEARFGWRLARGGPLLEPVRTTAVKGGSAPASAECGPSKAPYARR